MLHTSELLPIEERVAVLDRLSQKLSNSGYRIVQIRRTLIGGLSRYEKLLRWSKMPEGAGYRPLHLDAGGTLEARTRKKLVGKNNWYKQDKQVQNEDQMDKTSKR